MLSVLFDLSDDEVKDKIKDSGRGIDIKEVMPNEIELFASSSYELTDASRKALDSYAEYLVSHPDLKVTVEGYTDSSGKREYNVWLSRKRAEAVKAYLVDAGVDAARITAAGRGPANPVASNATEDGRRLNRRTEIRLQ